MSKIKEVEISVKIKELKIQLAWYLNYIADQPETRQNDQLIDCVVLLLQQKPDTEGSLNEKPNQH